MPSLKQADRASRRRFMGTGVAASLAAGAMVHSSVAAAESRRELRLGLIGCGGRGTGAVNDSLSINDGVTLVAGDLSAGHTAGAPFDVILIEGAVDDVPDTLIGQLAQGGRLVTIETGAGIGRAIVLTKSAAAVSKRVAFDAAGALLPGFERAKGFVF